MRKKQIIVLSVVLGCSLLGLIYMQAKYFQTAFKLKKAQFDYAVNRSLDEAIAYVEERDKLNEIKKERKNYRNRKTDTEKDGKIFL